MKLWDDLEREYVVCYRFACPVLNVKLLNPGYAQGQGLLFAVLHDRVNVFRFPPDCSDENLVPVPSGGQAFTRSSGGSAARPNQQESDRHGSGSGSPDLHKWQLIDEDRRGLMLPEAFLTPDNPRGVIAFNSGDARRYMAIPHRPPQRSTLFWVAVYVRSPAPLYSTVFNTACDLKLKELQIIDMYGLQFYSKKQSYMCYNSYVYIYFDSRVIRLITGSLLFRTWTS